MTETPATYNAVLPDVQNGAIVFDAVNKIASEMYVKDIESLIKEK